MLTISGLSKTYPNGVEALKKIDLTIGKGMFGLLGPNGAGKSSLMRTLAMLQEADEGRVMFKDINIFEQPDFLRQNLGYLPQDFDVYPRISAYDLLNHLAILKGLSKSKERAEAVEGLLAQTNLWEVRKKSVSTFSGGMKQRFGIAQALLGDPDLIIVDEPTAGLDPEERNRFHNLLSAVGENKVVLLSTHIVDDVEELCSELAILADGSIQLTGKPSDLINTLQGQVWRKLIKKGELEAYRAKYDVISTRLKAGETLIHVISGEPLDSFEQLQPDLEDVYFSILFQTRKAA